MLTEADETTGVGRKNGETMSGFMVPVTMLSFGRTFGDEGSMKECFVAAVSWE